MNVENMHGEKTKTIENVTHSIMAYSLGNAAMG